MPIRRDSIGRFAGGSGGKAAVNPGSKAAANRAAAKAAGMTFGAYVKAKAKAGRKVDKAQEAKRITSNRKARVEIGAAKKMEGRSWQAVRASVRRQQGRSV